MHYYFYYIEAIVDIFSNPFVILLTGLLLGRVFLLPRILINKSIDYKIETIKRIVEIKNIIKEIQFLHDRTHSTLISAIKKRETISKEILDQEIGKLSEKINEKLPLHKAYLDTEMEIYFKEDNLIQNQYKAYLEELIKFHNFILDMPEKYDVFKIKLNEYKEIREMGLLKKEDSLIKAVLQGTTLHKSLQ